MSKNSPTARSAEANAQDKPPRVEEQDGPDSQDRNSRPADQENMKSKEPSPYTASIYPRDNAPLPPKLGKEVLKLQDMLNADVWLLLQDGSGRYGDIGPSVKDAFFAARSDLTKARQKGRRIALLIDSLGGDAKAAYQLATFFTRYCGGFAAVVPRFAKSAATLLTLGADEIILGRCAELGPLDTQIYNLQRNGYIPVLDKVKALERLHASALELVDRSVTLLALRSGKPPEEMLDRALRFAADVTRPLLEKFDADEYTRMSRYLKRGEDYATRLLESRYDDIDGLEGNAQVTQGDDQEPEQAGAMTTEDIYEDYLLGKDPQARLLAQHLVGAYPDHSFAIEVEEATKLLPQIPERSEDKDLRDLRDQLDVIYQVLADQPDSRVMAVGQVISKVGGKEQKKSR
jgi:hypothetical protein